MRARIRGLEAWVNYLDDKQLPVLRQTLQKILDITESDRATVARLSAAVLEDPDLASNVLKLANSVIFNPSRTSISTVSRAIMVVGFNGVKSMTVTSILVDRIPHGKQRESVCRCLAKSLHSAMQARFLAQKLPAIQREAVFVAALLSHIGEVAFWASDASEGILNEYMERLAQEPAETQREILGTTFKAISRSLATRWNLGDLIEEALGTPRTLPARMVASAMAMGQLFEQSVSGDQRVDWHKTSLSLCRPVLNMEDKALLRALNENKQAACDLAAALGIAEAGKFLKKSGVKPAVPVLSPDPGVQLNCLQNIAQRRGGRFDESLIDQVLTCLHEGAGFERVAVFLSRTSESTAKKAYQLLKCKGGHDGGWYPGRQLVLPHWFATGEVRPFNPFNKVDRGKLLDAQETLEAPFNGANIPALALSFPVGSGFYALIYADRVGSGEITRAQEASFNLLFCTLSTTLGFVSPGQASDTSRLA